jgi:hypothetical protein
MQHRRLQLRQVAYVRSDPQILWAYDATFRVATYWLDRLDEHEIQRSVVNPDLEEGS